MAVSSNTCSVGLPLMKFRSSVFRKAKKGCFRKQTKMKYRLKDWLYKVNSPTFKISVVHDVFRKSEFDDRGP